MNVNQSLEEYQHEVNAERQSYFDKLHSAELANISRNFTDDEHMDIAKTISSKILSDELERRNRAVDMIIGALSEKALQINDNMNLMDKEKLIAEIRQIVRV